MIKNNLIKAASFTPSSLHAPNAWVGHMPFSCWIIQEIAPKIFVELGTHTGNSYFSFCQAVVEANLSTKCYAVDTWQGDEHAGQYNDDIFTEVNANNHEKYAGFSRLLRMTFDDAASYFEDESVELLHIDGLHTYEAVRHDFETWLPKLAPGAVVMFHDTNVHERNFGVWKLWEELQVRYPSNLEFLHSHGLGVLKLNNATDEKKLEWLQPNVQEKKILIDYFAALGSRQLDRFELSELKLHAANAVAERESMLKDKDVAWTVRLNQCSQDYQLEIARIAAERDLMLRDKDLAWRERLDQCSQDYQLEIARISAERDLMLIEKHGCIYDLSDNPATKVSVVTVNFNGKKFLKELLDSLSRQTLQPEEIIVVDNCSSDGSVEYLKEYFPYVKIVQGERNLGFAGGNNIGVLSAKYPLIALINNDTVVESTWLSHLVGTWINRTVNGEKIGAVSPKIRFFNKFLSFKFSSELFTPGGTDERSLGVAFDFSKTGVVGVAYVKPIAVLGFHNEEQWPEERNVRWTSGPAVLMLPIEEIISGSVSILRVVVTTGGKPSGTELRVECEGLDLGSYHVTDVFTELKIEIPTSLLDSANWVINNAGSRLDKYGNAADIGINQPDHGQFDALSDLDAFCGCSVLIPRNLFLNLGGFDERFFMYYEDVDLSWRMRRKGLLIVFEPRSVVRHIHAGSSGEWSPSFRYHVTRNYRLNGFKNARVPQMLVLTMRLLLALGRSLRVGGLGMWRKRSTKKLQTMSAVEIEFRALADAFVLAPGILTRRMLALWKKR
ncbi:MAG: class I SAM-dependent methyltransferase [Cytophaga sp.]|nr:class I SAM-dependent methyltransferase [Undibacterium sp.]